MKYNAKLQGEIEKFKEYVIIVEGKKDVQALKSLGFDRVYAIHSTGVSIRERVEQIMPFITRKDRVCILSDLDRKGKQLYEKLKPIFQEFGAKLDSTLRGILIKSRVSHIEGLSTFMGKIDQIE